MRFLLDTNVISELRKGDRADRGVREWFAATPGNHMWTSVLVIGEIRRGIESVRRRDPAQAAVLHTWLEGYRALHADRVLPVDEAVADCWGPLNIPDPLPTVDALLAATALVYGMTLVTRNTQDVVGTGVALLNPFSPGL